LGSIKPDYGREGLDSAVSSMATTRPTTLKVGAMGSHLLTIKEVAEQLGVSERTVHRKIRERAIHTVKLGPGEKAAVRIEARELERFIAKAYKRGRVQRLRWATNDIKTASRERSPA
jgi:excisionase family DNA binding protein